MHLKKKSVKSLDLIECLKADKLIKVKTLTKKRKKFALTLHPVVNNTTENLKK